MKNSQQKLGFRGIIKTLLFSVFILSAFLPFTIQAANTCAVATCENIDGWASDPDVPNSTLDIQIYRDGPVGTGSLVGTVTADQPYASRGNHGFSFPIPAYLKNNTPITFYLYSIGKNKANTNDDVNTLLGTKVIQCGGGGKPQCSDGADNDGDGKIDYPADPGCTDANDDSEVDTAAYNPEGFFDDAYCTTANGWALDRDVPTSPIDVHLYADGGGFGTFLGSVTANGSRPDVGTYYRTSVGIETGDNHGFLFNIPLSLKDNNPHQIYAYGINNSGGSNTLLLASPKTITCPVPPIAAPTVSLVAAPITIVAGNSSTLTWSSTNATACSASWGGAIALSDSTSVTPASTTTYTVTCTGPGGSASKSVTVTVNPSIVDNTPEGVLDFADCNSLSGWSLDRDSMPAPIDVNFYLDGAMGVGTLIGTVTANTLRPDVNAYYQATYGVNTGDYHGFIFNTPLSIKDNTDHLLYAYAVNNNSAGIDNITGGSPKTINCPPPSPSSPAVSLSANPTIIPSGGTSVLTWSSTNTTSCSSSWAGPVTTSGVDSVSPTSNTTYTLTCSGPGGTADVSATVSISGGGSGSPACSNGADDDSDGFIDALDSACHSDNNPANPASYTPGGLTEVGGGGGPVSLGFTISSTEGSTSPIQFLAGLGATSQPRTIEVNPSGGFSGPVILSVTDIRSKNSGSPLPTDVIVTYGFDGLPMNPTLVWSSIVGRYINAANKIGSAFTVTFSKAVTEPYNVTIHGVSGALTADYVLTIDPKAKTPIFQEQ